jgi:CSLREA domain-containing protein
MRACRILGVTVLALAGLGTAAARATTIVPNTLADQFGGKPAECALREAIEAAMTDDPFGGCPRGSGAAERDIVSLGPGTYKLTRAGTDDTNSRGDLDVSEGRFFTVHGVDIVHEGPGRATIDGEGIDRVLHVLEEGGASVEGLTIRDGLAPAGGGAALAEGSLSLVQVTLSKNEALGGGGALATIGPDASLSLVNTTVSGNVAASPGGGIAHLNGSATLVHSTITDNLTNGEVGGGIEAGGGTLTLRNTILAGNLDPGGDVRPDCSGGGSDITTHGGNLFGSVAGCGIPFDDEDHYGLTGLDLGPLADNGGPTRTHAPAPGSTALGLGIVPGAGPTEKDQRGVDRNETSPDSGAYELTRCRGVIVNRVGSSGADDLVGTPGPDGFLGLGGQDRLTGHRGADGLCAGRGADILEGMAGADELVGSAGPDVLLGGRGDDLLLGGRGADLCTQDERDDPVAC